MTFKKVVSLICFIYIGLYLCLPCFGEVSYVFGESSPTNVEIEGVLRPSEDVVLNGIYESNIAVFSTLSEEAIYSVTENVSFFDNYFRINMDLGTVLSKAYGEGADVNIHISVNEDLFIDLPLASVPKVVKSYYSAKTMQSYDPESFFVDYANSRVGIGTSNPQETLSISGNVTATGYIIGDGSQLTNLPYKGSRSDNYNFLESENGEFIIVTVNATGSVMVGGRFGKDIPTGNLQVFGSLLVEENDGIETEILSGKGSRWMWYSDRSIFRIGYVPSYYWDDQFSGDYSIAFGYATLATGNYSIVTGGFYNSVLADNSIIAGGAENSVHDSNSIILGGQKNTIYDNGSIILGGLENYTYDDSIILGGRENYGYGATILAGYQHLLNGEVSIALGGKNNYIDGDFSMAIGSYINIEHDSAIVFSTNEASVTSDMTSSIKLVAANGVGINTNQTESNKLSVSGAVLANKFIGDGGGLTNIKADESAWTSLGSNDIFYEYKLGVGTSNLIESLTVSGSLFLTGEAEDTAGTLRFSDDNFEVYHDDEWITLTMVDTNTTFSAKENIGLDVSTNTFYLTTENVIVGQVFKWDGSMWGPGYVDQFIELPLSEYMDDVSKSKRLFFEEGNVAVGTSSVSNYPFYVKSDHTTAAYFNSEDGIISLSVDPVGLHFEGFYSDFTFESNSISSAGFFIDESTEQLKIYVQDASTNSNETVLFLHEDNISIGETDLSYPFMVNGSMGMNQLIITESSDSDADFLMLNRKMIDDEDPYNSVVFQQTSDGELFIQSGPETYSSDILFHQAGQQVARLMLDNLDSPRFGLTGRYVRSALDISSGHIHLDSNQGVRFYENADQHAALLFSDDAEKSIQIFTDSDMDTPIFSVSSTGNIAINSDTNDAYDVIVNGDSGSQLVLQLDSDQSVTQTVQLSVDSGSFEIVNDSDDHLSIDQDGDTVIRITNDGYVGIHDPTPNQSVSVGKSIALTNQSGFYLKDQDESTVVSMIPDGDVLKVNSSDHIQFLSMDGKVAVSIEEDKVGVYTEVDKGVITNSLTDLDQTIGFQVEGVMKSRDFIEDTQGYIFPLMMNNEKGDLEVREIQTITLDTYSGLNLAGDGTADDPALISYGSYYNRYQLPSGEIFAAEGNMDLRLIGRGVTILSNDQVDQGTSSSMLDSLTMVNDLISGGVISGNFVVNGTVTTSEKFYGDARYIFDIPFRWQHVTRNVSGSSPVEYDEGEIYYLLGDVGIGIENPQYDFSVAGLAYLHETNVTENLDVPIIYSTENLTIVTSANVNLNSDVIIMGHNAFDATDDDFIEYMRISDDSKWYIGSSSGNGQFYLTSDSNVEFRIDSNEYGVLDLIRDDNDDERLMASLRYDPSGNVFETDFGESNLQLISHDDHLNFYTHTDSHSLSINTDGTIGIFRDSPTNTLDVAGNMSVGYNDLAPDNSLIVDGIVGVGLDLSTIPIASFEVSGSVIIGSAYAPTIPNAFFMNGSEYSMNIGGLRKSTESLFVDGDIFISEGYWNIRLGSTDVFSMQREVESNKDRLEYAVSNATLSFAADAIEFNTYASSDWQNDMVIDSNGNVGVGGTPETILHVQDDDNDSIVQLNAAGGNEPKVMFENSSSDSASLGVFGVSGTGLSFQSATSTLDDPELTIDGSDTVGINNKTPDSSYKVDVAGNINASNILISDKFSSTGYSEFETVPPGVIIIWMTNSIPDGWALCDGNPVMVNNVSINTPDLSQYFIKSSNSSGSNVGDYSYGDDDDRDTHTGILRSEDSGHDHDSVSHNHYLSTSTHTHSISNYSANISGSDSQNTFQSLGGTEAGHTVNTHDGEMQADADGLHDDYGSHYHDWNNTHTHSFSPQSSGSSHNHGVSNGNWYSSSSSHNHLADNDDTEHEHEFDGRPESLVVNFIMKVDE